MFQIKTPRTVYGEEPLIFWLHCNASPNVRSPARKIHMSNTQAGNGENVSASFFSLSASISAYSLGMCVHLCKHACVYVCARGN